MEPTITFWGWARIAFQWLLVIGLVVVCFITCEDNRAYSGNIIAARDSIQYLTNRDSTKTATIRTMELSQADMKRHMAAQDADYQKLASRFSEVRTATRFTAVARLDTVRAAFATPLLSPEMITCSQNGLPLKTGPITGEWFAAQYIVDNGGVTLTDVRGTVTATVITGFKRKWIFGRQYAATDITPHDKNITITTVTTATAKVPQRWGERIAIAAVSLWAGTQIAK